jgi:DNA-binding winged helix-turn-helix (wHTH) protein/tetratricopeptide (TPR) repeat protein
MTAAPKVFYEFGPFRVDPDKQLLLRHNQPIAITPKAFETLLILVRHSREVVSKEELMKTLWPDSFVEEANLSQNIFVLRKTLGDTPDDRRYIVTLPGRGYRFAEQVRTVSQGNKNLPALGGSDPPVAAEAAPAEIIPVPPAATRRTRIWSYLVSAAAVLVLVALGAIVLSRRHQPVALAGTDSVLLSDFANSTGDPVFDGALRQGLEVQLQQSPFLSLVSQDRIQKTLRMMGQQPDVRLTPEIAREICERTGTTAVLDGSIARLGSQYVIGLRAMNCRTGDILDEEQVQAARKEGVLDALSQIAVKFRTRVGESLATVAKHDTPLTEATTSSLEALKAYSAARRVQSSSGDVAALPLFQRATELDPQFAMAYALQGFGYGDLGEATLSAESANKAYQLRNRASDTERFFITISYDLHVTGNMERALQNCEAWAQAYPREMIPHGFMGGIIYPILGKYENATAEAKKVTEMDPDFAIGYNILALNYTSLNRLDDAESTLQLAARRRLEVPDFVVDRYQIAFLRDDRTGMQREAAQGQAKPPAEAWTNYLVGFGVAYFGQLREARSRSQRAVDLAVQSAQKERAALFETGTSLREAFFGNAAAAQRSALTALRLSKGRDVEYGAAFALALSGDSTRAQILENDLANRFPEDTAVQFSYLPALRGLLLTNRGDSAKALDALQNAGPYELGQPPSSFFGFFGVMYPVYVRGQAHLKARRGAEAAAEFQKILDHRTVVITDPVGALAHLQLARALVVEGDMAKAKNAYQEFLALWANADPDIPVLRQAKAEYARLR